MPTRESVVEILLGGYRPDRPRRDGCLEGQGQGRRPRPCGGGHSAPGPELDHLAEHTITLTWDNLSPSDCVTWRQRATTSNWVRRADHRHCPGNAFMAGFAEVEELPIRAGSGTAGRDRPTVRDEGSPRPALAALDPAQLEKGLAQAARGEFVETEEIYREFPELQNKGGS